MTQRPSLSPSVVWFRLDLRLEDNPALAAAAKQGGPVVPLFVWAPEEEAPWPPGAASRWWLHQSLAALDRALGRLGSRLLIRSGPSGETLRQVIHCTRAGAVFWNRRYEPTVRARDQQLENELRAQGLEVQTFNSALLHEPWTIQNRAGAPFQVFTPFWKRCQELPPPRRPIPCPRTLKRPRTWPESTPLGALQLEPRLNWTLGLHHSWRPGSEGAQLQLSRFLDHALVGYADGRDTPGLPGTSRLSPHLHFGEISPHQVWHAVHRRAQRAGANRKHIIKFLTELGWREFAHHLLFHFPRTSTEPLRAGFRRFPWRQSSSRLQAWQKGCTGYPIVDAGMRELWATGWMHNRVRMIVASFLVKDLLISWQEGAKWFWDTLVDADLAQNTLGWQWTAGCGADAAPYFRIFNPVNQGERFDAAGAYVRRWCPELAALPNRWVHRPWQAPDQVLRDAGVDLGRSYPQPVVSHAAARLVALDAFDRAKASGN